MNVCVNLHLAKGRLFHLIMARALLLKVKNI